MLVYVYGQDMTLQGIAEEAISVIWRRRYCACGDFAAVFPANAACARILGVGRIVMIEGCGEAGCIDYVSFRLDAEGPQIEIQGKFLPWLLLGGRVLVNPICMTGTWPQIIARMVNDNAINPADADRAIPDLTLLDQTTVTRTPVEYASERENMLTAIERGAQSAQLGFKVISDPVQRAHTLVLYDGVDRSRSNQSGNAPCVFGVEWENVLEQTLTISGESVASAAYVLGAEDEDGARSVAFAGGGDGLARREIYLDASDIAREDEQGGALTQSEYTALLAQRGQDELADRKEVKTLDSQINAFGNLVYQVDFDVGDVVTCESAGWGVTMDARITGITQTWQVNENTIEATFGAGMPTALKQVRRLIKGS